MPSYNKVLLMGNLTRDIELKSIGSGQSVGKFGLAINRHYTTQSGEKREEVTFVDCEAWGKTAETMARFLTKGRPVFVEGRLKLDQWTDKESGKNRSALRVVIDNFQFVDSKGGEGGGGGGGGGGGNYARSGTPAAAQDMDDAPPGGGAMAGDDIPF
ncbi:MAG: single-stranded DNA-binding protein [Phycisphaerae bacterium]|nr:single-stranded DNA-binding protein [Phycisphaerae bacterium]